MDGSLRKVALITGGSRGIGASTTLALAKAGYSVVIIYRNKAARAEAVVQEAQSYGVRACAVGCDITNAADRERLFATIREEFGALHLLVLNASGGLERDLVAANPDYPMVINRDAQVALLEQALPLLPQGSTIVFVTSHWAHLYGRVPQIPAYEPVAASKYAGEQALLARQDELNASGIRLLIVTGDLIQDTITPKLLERSAPGLAMQRKQAAGDLPTAEEMGQMIAEAACNESLPSGHVLVIGGSLEQMLAG
ncbi:NAD(P)-dependent dehydrogenase (short-subunit alcohol dehydrogenase family) [Thermosporothrix hazakensis]|jgi:NAD(P)-dependent dehydrogenase (short-subunit alcohol dehydrogenase family)|uniref:NAD(P)-dependent dehydrogenase (Short-subunit alcohol dehydrogenase family) n=1 Tax=Thermosporothrix hazakensis TaxID=644383 RepID=A0A326U706_THEHA|nr:SDR family oxidoreductase [Thermosporothrix hazakensis]PZW26387.1 NAD(P)-dependent dehydrogenase (short-subunit alcohol dehydrogenase family) [Thermosporothrix hazakensis]GCE48661.1 short chain dehydrogenase [Thermosporothrix hazakensis]